LSSEERKKILLDIADALEANEDAIRRENEADVEAAQDAGYEKSLVARMTLKPGKVVLVFHFLFFCSYGILSSETY
jgi:delta-1-pyrroline-5-carboxylate synthetase